MSLAPWQEQVYQRAAQAHGQGRLGHGLLLVGPAHLGKRDVAEALAKRLLCKSPSADGHACNACRSCHLFKAQAVGLATLQAHPDLQRISLEPNDKGDKLRSEISVEQIRRLSQWFALTAQMGGAQVAIIEPADAMNLSASNALLKTLEEPAPNRFLLIVTSRPGRLPATIRSRCQRIEFHLPPADQSHRWLLEQGADPAQADAALAAARNNPGQAWKWMGDGSLGVRRQVRDQLAAVAAGKSTAIDVAQRWLSDDLTETRLRFAADLALEAAARQLGVPSKAADALPPPAEFMPLSRWFDAVNRCREQLPAPLRQDLVLAGLLHEWRTMFANRR